MSRVTDIILTCSIADEDDESGIVGAVLPLNNYLIANHNCKLARVDQHAGGDKVVTSCVFMAALNHLDEAEFLNQVQRLPWQSADDVRVFVQREEESHFHQVYPAKEPQ